jgi:hypothetical protein
VAKKKWSKEEKNIEAIHKKEEKRIKEEGSF